VDALDNPVYAEMMRGVEAGWADRARGSWCYALTQCAGVASIGLGEADLRADLGVTENGGLLYARSRIINAAAAAGLLPPHMSVHPDVGDVDGLRRSCEVGHRLGFLGRAAIHPGSCR
jgi:citrate lyase subunit beta/citryl-CoA lyase